MAESELTPPEAPPDGSERVASVHKIRAQQAITWSVALIAAFVMIFLGLWQMQVFTDQGNRTAADRAAQPAVPLLQNITTDGRVTGDILGKRVTVSGQYLPDEQVIVRDEKGTLRLVTALLLADGRALAIVRGTVTSAAALPAPPSGSVSIEGLFLPQETASDRAAPAGQLPVVRLSMLAQLWPQTLAPGFVTLDGSVSAGQGLGAASVSLPSDEGSWRNGGYALQWWAFAIFAIAMAATISRSLGKRLAAPR